MIGLSNGTATITTVVTTRINVDLISLIMTYQWMLTQVSCASGLTPCAYVFSWVDLVCLHLHPLLDSSLCLSPLAVIMMMYGHNTSPPSDSFICTLSRLFHELANFLAGIAGFLYCISAGSHSWCSLGRSYGPSGWNIWWNSTSTFPVSSSSLVYQHLLRRFAMYMSNWWTISIFHSLMKRFHHSIFKKYGFSQTLKLLIYLNGILSVRHLKWFPFVMPALPKCRMMFFHLPCPVHPCHFCTSPSRIKLSIYSLCVFGVSIHCFARSLLVAAMVTRSYV